MHAIGICFLFSSNRYTHTTQYIVHGCEISLITAIDFTGSNLVHSDPKSLHYMGNPGELSYIWCLR